MQGAYQMSISVCTDMHTYIQIDTEMDYPTFMSTRYPGVSLHRPLNQTLNGSNLFHYYAFTISLANIIDC